ncbi:pyruvate kinase [Terrihabitans rhizophilus]|jgi:pyruvate kinase|uniref:Pyruvate kinase n=1 Tax=Terrihabitans rhizophilus TaxID=3092662 RepID=A0ABU4RPH0_9HYPH|nr:pyruvate kinase [Terrihabitans sp. PJ23]MDX6806738.1 pyruvate kinase [Terrihabitans sp. PJ23]
MRNRNTKIVATVGPSSSSPEQLRALFDAGVDMFRLNMSHGTHDDHRKRFEAIRAMEKETGRPIGILLDLQGPKLRVGTFAEGPVTLVNGETFRFDLDNRPGDKTRAYLPHPEIFAAARPGVQLLLDDGKIRMEVEEHGEDYAIGRIITGGVLSERKGVSVVGAVLPLAALTEKDYRDLEFGLENGADWVALSFVQRPEDILEAREIIGDRALIMSKLEKPAAVERLAEIVEASDAIMVARGDLGVEMQPEEIPPIQRRMIKMCREYGKPVVVATQMLESMIHTPTPTRAEASDVATAVYEGADAVMLSAESASGKFPVVAVEMMSRIVTSVEKDPDYKRILESTMPKASATIADAICSALRQTADILPLAAAVTYTTTGSTTLRAARERPLVPIFCLTPSTETARRMSCVWGVSAIVTRDLEKVSEIVAFATDAAKGTGVAKDGDFIAVTAGMPFAQSGTTNLLRIFQIGDR